MSQQTPAGQRSSISATAALEARKYFSECKASPLDLLGHHRTTGLKTQLSSVSPE